MSAAVIIVAFMSLINGNKGQQIPLERCVDGEIVNCVRAPCDDAICPRYPDAVCMNDYCDGCNARFFDQSDTQYQHQLNCEEAAVSCANVRCTGPCLDTSQGPKCCPLDQGCSTDDYNKQNCIKCDGITYDNECYAICNGNNIESARCSPCSKKSDCRTAGCSGELCVSRDSDITASICIFKCEFKCLQFQTCRKNENGDCVWSTHRDDVSKYEQCMKGCNNNNTAGPKICACPMIYNPICCDGKTYSNPCEAECKGGIRKPAEKQPKCVMGECQKMCACQDIYNPICCNGKTYDNECMAECKGGINPPAKVQEECEMGECRNELLSNYQTMRSRFEEDSDASDNEATPTTAHPKLKRKASIIPFHFVDIEAVESDGEGGDVNNDEDDDGFWWDDNPNVDTDDDDEEEEEEDESMNGFIAKDNEIEFEDDIDDNDTNDYDSVINHIQIRNKLNAEMDENSDDASISSDNINENDDEKQMELIKDNTETLNGNNDNDDDKQKQKLLEQLTKSKPNTKQSKQSSRYYDVLSNDKNVIIMDDESDSSSESEQTDSDYIDSSDDEEDENEDQNVMNIDDKDDNNENNDETEIEKDGLSELSKLEFEKLLSHTMVNLALKLEENDNKNLSQQINPFATMDDVISLETNNDLNMKELLSFISDDNNTEKQDTYNDEINDENINNPKDFEDIIPFEKSHNMLPEPKTSSSNHPSNLRTSKLNTISNLDKNNKNNTFIQEEIRLAENTMKKAITRSRNIERKNFAPPLSSLDPRVHRRKRGENAGKGWFNMPAGKLTPENKLHFLMLKYRHMLYRDYKPTKVKDDFIPKYFQIGTVIEGPTEFYSSRLTKKQRRSSWANEYLNDRSTKQWLEEKTKRAQNRIRRPGSKFWAPMKKLNVNNRYKLRKKIIKNRKKKAWKK